MFIGLFNDTCPQCVSKIWACVDNYTCISSPMTIQDYPWDEIFGSLYTIEIFDQNIEDACDYGILYPCNELFYNTLDCVLNNCILKNIGVLCLYIRL